MRKLDFRRHCRGWVASARFKLDLSLRVQAPMGLYLRYRNSRAQSSLAKVLGESAEEG